MLYKYAIAWNECAIAFKELQLWEEAAEAYRNTMRLYAKLQSKVQLAFATGDYYLCLLVLGVEGETEEYLDYDDQSKYS